MSVRQLMTILGLLMLAPLAQAAIYKWVDERGNVHYGERPVGSQAEELKISNDPGPVPAVPEQERLEKQQRLLQGYEKRRAEDRKQRDDEAKKAEERKQACLKVRDKLRYFEESRYLYRLGENGERRILTNEERAAETDRLRGEVKRYCD